MKRKNIIITWIFIFIITIFRLGFALNNNDINKVTLLNKTETWVFINRWFFEKMQKNEKIDDIIDKITIEYTDIYDINSHDQSYSDLQDPVYNKHKFDFLYYYGLYKSQSFLKDIKKSSISDREIKSYEDNAKESLKKLLEANYKEWLWLISVFVWESSKYFINKELFAYKELEPLPSINLQWYLYEKKLVISWLDSEKESYYKEFWDLYVWYNNTDDIYWTFKNINFNNRLKTVIWPNEKSNINFININSIKNIKNIDSDYEYKEVPFNMKNEYEWKDNIFWFRLYIKINNYYYSISGLYNWWFFLSNDNIIAYELDEYFSQSGLISEIDENNLQKKIKTLISNYKNKWSTDIAWDIQREINAKNQKIDETLLKYLKVIKKQSDFKKYQNKINILLLERNINYRISYWIYEYLK